VCLVTDGVTSKRVRAQHVASSLHRQPASADALAKQIEQEHSWMAAKAISQKAMKIVQSPKKREGPSFLCDKKVDKIAELCHSQAWEGLEIIRDLPGVAAVSRRHDSS